MDATEILQFQRAAVFGATGATGREVVHELLRRGVHVRAVSRSPDHLARDFGGTEAEQYAADLADRAAAIEAAAGCELIFHCVGLPLAQFGLHIPLARNSAAAMEAHGARGLLVTSYWSYGPGDDRPMPEDRPLAPGSEKAGIRREQENVLLQAGAAVARLPDFYGPGAEISLLNDGLKALAAGKSVLWPGDPDAPRDFIFIPDTGRLLCDLAERSAAYGQPWNVPGSGAEPPRKILERAASLRGTRLRLRRGTRWMVALAGLFRPDIREFKDLLPLYERPVILDVTRIRKLLAEIRNTPYEEGIRRTFAWLDRAAA
jgi:nucleoside-diphosphate-sugar epimerase